MTEAALEQDRTNGAEAIEGETQRGADAGAVGTPETEGANAGADAEAGKDGAGKDASGEAKEPQWREDWREKFAGKDEKTLARLKRFASPENVFRSFLELEKKFS